MGVFTELLSVVVVVIKGDQTVCLRLLPQIRKSATGTVNIGLME